MGGDPLKLRSQVPTCIMPRKWIPWAPVLPGKWGRTLHGPHFPRNMGIPCEMRDPWMTDCFQGVWRLSVWQTIITEIWNPKFCKISESSGENATITILFGFCCGLVPRLSPSKRLGKRLVLLYIFLSVYRLLTGVGGTKKVGESDFLWHRCQYVKINGDPLNGDSGSPYAWENGNPGPCIYYQENRDPGSPFS